MFQREEHRFDVHIHYAVPFLLGVSVKRFDMNHARIVYHDIQSAKMPDCLTNRIAHLDFTAHVATQGQGPTRSAFQNAGEALGQGESPSDDRYVRALLGE